jgi:hypothetical protein
LLFLIIQPRLGFPLELLLLRPQLAAGFTCARFLSGRSSLSSALSLRISIGTAMANILRWIHLSDLHVRKEALDGLRPVLDALWKDIPQQIERLGGPLDFVAFTGDIAFSGRADEYSLAEIDFFKPLKDLVDVPWSRFFVVPGNHDVDRRLVSNINNRGWRDLRWDATRVDAILTDRNQRDQVLGTMPDYARFIAGLGRDVGGHLMGDNPRYAYVARLPIGDSSVAIVGLNTAWLSSYVQDTDGNFLDRGNLVLGGKQLQDTLPSLQRGGSSSRADLYVVLMHHPLEYLSEDDKLTVEVQLQRECRLVLHGHLHVPKLERLNSLIGQTTFIPAGTIYQDRKWLNGYNLGQLNLESGQGEVRLRRYAPDRMEFVDDVQATGDKRHGSVPLNRPLKRGSATGVRAPARQPEVDRLMGNLQPKWLRVGRRRETQEFLNFLDRSQKPALWIWGAKDTGVLQFLDIVRAILRERRITLVEFDAADSNDQAPVDETYFVSRLRQAAGLDIQVVRDTGTSRIDREMLSLASAAVDRILSLGKPSLLLFANLHLLTSRLQEWVTGAFRDALLERSQRGTCLGVFTWEGPVAPAVEKMTQDLVQLSVLTSQEIESFFGQLGGLKKEKVKQLTAEVLQNSVDGTQVSCRIIYDRLRLVCIRESLA